MYRTFGNNYSWFMFAKSNRVNGKKTKFNKQLKKKYQWFKSKSNTAEVDTTLSDADMLKFSLKARQMMTNQKPQFGIPLWLWHGFKSWNVHGTPTESGWDVAMKGERKRGRRMEKKDWSSRLMAWLGMKTATRNKIHTNNLRLLQENFRNRKPDLHFLKDIPLFIRHCVMTTKS